MRPPGRLYSHVGGEGTMGPLIATWRLRAAMNGGDDRYEYLERKGERYYFRHKVNGLRFSCLIVVLDNNMSGNTKVSWEC
jgi:hypothetical protein